jgi:hypothetical protein
VAVTATMELIARFKAPQTHFERVLDDGPGLPTSAEVKRIGMFLDYDGNYDSAKQHFGYPSSAVCDTPMMEFSTNIPSRKSTTKEFFCCAFLELSLLSQQSLQSHMTKRPLPLRPSSKRILPCIFTMSSYHRLSPSAPDNICEYRNKAIITLNTKAEMGSPSSPLSFANLIFLKG